MHHHIQHGLDRRVLSPPLMQAAQPGGASGLQPLVAQVSLPLTLLIERGANAQALLPQRALTVALLVDGENCSPDLVAAALAEADKYGVVHVRRVYANWAVMSQRSWKEALSRHHLEAIHHERTAIGKNATDIALVVDAMDLLHSSVITCFCLLASDSDYTPLVERLRAADRVVVGLGRAQTPSSLTQACSVFVHLEPSGSPAVGIARARRCARVAGDRVAAGCEAGWLAVSKRIRHADQAYRPDICIEHLRPREAQNPDQGQWRSLRTPPAKR